MGYAKSNDENFDCRFALHYTSDTHTDINLQTDVDAAIFARRMQKLEITNERAC